MKDIEVEKTKTIIEKRHLVIYGYSRSELAKIINQFRSQLPSSIKMWASTENLVTHFILTGEGESADKLRFAINRYHQQLNEIFREEVITTEDKTLSQVLGEILAEGETTISAAESCTGGNIAHRIVQTPRSSSYFLGSVVSYSNEVKTDVLKVSRSSISRFGAVSQAVAEEMANGVANLMRTHCALATTGIAGPDGGSKFKPVGTVWFAAKYMQNIISECVRFEGDRNTVMESATNHALVMMIRLLSQNTTIREDINDD